MNLHLMITMFLVDECGFADKQIECKWDNSRLEVHLTENTHLNLWISGFHVDCLLYCDTSSLTVFDWTDVHDPKSFGFMRGKILNIVENVRSDEQFVLDRMSKLLA